MPTATNALADERPTLNVKYSSRRSLLGLADPKPSEPTLFVPSTERVVVGASLRLKVSFADCGKNFHVTGQVREVRESLGQRTGFTLLVTTAAERRAFTALLAFCARNQEPAKRFSTSIACTVRVGAEQCTGRIRDVSMTGAFIAVNKPSVLKDGATIDVEWRAGFLNLGKTRLKAQVVWRGEKQGAIGIGAQFLDGTQQVLAALKKNGVFPS